MAKKFHYDFNSGEYATEGTVTLEDVTGMCTALLAHTLTISEVPKDKVGKAAGIISTLIVDSYFEDVENG